MPYLPEARREFVDATGPVSAGDLNYEITSLCDRYLDGRVDYEAVNKVIGVLECAKLEFYRRIAGPYEDTKIEQNGDVYSEDLIHSTQ